MKYAFTAPIGARTDLILRAIFKWNTLSAVLHGVSVAAIVGLAVFK